MKANDDTVDAPRAGETETCISCLQTNIPDTHFCRHCGTPLTCYATTAPFEHIFAFGDFLRKATRPGRWNKPVRICILACVYLILFSVLLGLLLP